MDFLEDFDPGQLSDQGGVPMGESSLMVGREGGKHGAANGNGYGGMETSPYSRQPY